MVEEYYQKLFVPYLNTSTSLKLSILPLAEGGHNLEIYRLEVAVYDEYCLCFVAVGI